MEYNTVFILPCDETTTSGENYSGSIVANSEFYSIVNTENLDDLYKIFGIYMFDLINFDRYSNEKFINFFKKIKMVENKQFLNELGRILHRSVKPPINVIDFILKNATGDIIIVYYRLFSQVSLLVDSNFSKNLEATTNIIINHISCDIVNNLNDIELHCFFIRYCNTKENLLLAISKLCSGTLETINSRLSGTSYKEDCSCKIIQYDVESKKC